MRLNLLLWTADEKGSCGAWSSVGPLDTKGWLCFVFFFLNSSLKKITSISPCSAAKLRVVIKCSSNQVPKSVTWWSTCVLAYELSGGMGSLYCTESILHRMLFFVTSDGQHLSSPLPLERGEEVTTELVDSRLQYQLRDLTSIFVSLWNWLLLLWTPSLPPQLDSPSWAFLPFRSQPVICWLHSDPTDGSLLKIAVIIIIYILIRWPSTYFSCALIDFSFSAYKMHLF